jgi:hypothetical protein
MVSWYHPLSSLILVEIIMFGKKKKIKINPKGLLGAVTKRNAALKEAAMTPAERRQKKLHDEAGASYNK